jgi:glycerophosphoryl diester phosphodiesterase
MLTRTRWPYPRILAHRGGGTVAPENTLVGVRAAAGMGFAGVEIDVQLAACGTPILMHDATVDRTTDGYGTTSDLTADELRRLDAGIWFGNEYAGEHVPTLESAVTLCRATGLWMNVELKVEGDLALETGDVVAREMHRLWGDTSPAPLLSSFSEEALAAALEAAPTLPRALLVERPPADWQARVADLKCRALGVDHRHLDAAFIAAAHAAGIAVAAYTVNDTGRAVTLFEWGLDAVITDELRDIRGDFLAVFGLNRPGSDEATATSPAG